jgi:hypothetical protein
MKTLTLFFLLLIPLKDCAQKKKQDIVIDTITPSNVGCKN